MNADSKLATGVGSFLFAALATLPVVADQPLQSPKPAQPAATTTLAVERIAPAATREPNFERPHASSLILSEIRAAGGPVGTRPQLAPLPDPRLRSLGW